MNFTDITLSQVLVPITVVSPKGKVSQIHNRKHYSLSLCIEGQITYHIRDKQVVQDRNHVMLLPKGQSYSVHVNTAGLFPVMDFEAPDLDCQEIIAFPIANPESYIRQFQALKDAFNHKENRLKCFSLFYGILHQLQMEQNDPDAFFTRTLDYIERSLSDSTLTNRKIAEYLNISEVYFRKLFTNRFKTSPKQYILELRLQKAKVLLTESNWSVSAVGEACGFSSLYLFSRTFRERTGQAPTQYARENRKYSI